MGKYLPRLYVPISLFSNTSIELSPKHNSYLFSVLRLKENEQMRVFNSQDGEFCATILSYKPSCKLYLNKLVKLPESSTLEVYAALSIIKPSNFLDAIDMAIQLGIQAVQPIICANSQIRNINLERLQKRVIEATEQSNRIMIPKIYSPIKLNEFVSKPDIDLFICANEQVNVENTLKLNNKLPKKLAALIGPEGGFSVQEQQLLSNNNKVNNISLGANILRSETALIALLAQITLLSQNA